MALTRDTLSSIDFSSRQGPTGPAGQDGARGTKGDKGDKGDRGDLGPAGPQGDGFFPSSAQWSPTADYPQRAVVPRNGQTYLALRPNTGKDPEASPADWLLWAAKGDPGSAGTGTSSGTVDLDTVATVEDLVVGRFDTSTIASTATYVPLGVVPFPCRLAWAALMWTPGSILPNPNTAVDYWLVELGKFTDADSTATGTGGAFHPIVSKGTFGQNGAPGYVLGETPRGHYAWTFDVGAWDDAARVLTYRDTLYARWTKVGAPGNVSRIDYSYRLEPLR